MSHWTVLVTAVVLAAVGQAPQVKSVAVGQRRVTTAQFLQAGFTGSARDLVAAAERMPAADYSFKPTSMTEARTYGAVIAHAADGMFDACTRARGLSGPQSNIEKTMAEKGDIVAALKEAVATCEPAFATNDDSSPPEFVRQGPGVEVRRVAALIGVLAHNAEMYGIASVYLRAKNIVPPGSERR